MNVLVIDVGGTHVKILATGQKVERRMDSGPKLTAEQMVAGVRALAKGWKYDAVSIGYPGPVVRNRPGQGTVQPGQRVGRFRLRGRVRCPGEHRQRRGDAGVGQLQGRQDAVPGVRDRPWHHADRRRRHRADGARAPALQEGHVRGLRRRARVRARQEEMAQARRGRDCAPDRRVRAGGRGARRRQRGAHQGIAAALPAGRQRQCLRRRVSPVGDSPRHAKTARRPAKRARARNPKDDDHGVCDCSRDDAACMECASRAPGHRARPQAAQALRR